MGKVVAIISNLSKGGAQGVFVNVVNYLHGKGVDIAVAVQTLHDPIYREDLNGEIGVTDLDISSAKKMLPKLIEYVKSNDFDLVMAFSPEIAVNLVLARKLTGRKFTILARCINTLSYEYGYAKTFFRKHITHNLIRLFYHKVDRLIAQSKGMGDDLIAHYRFKKEQIEVINNALGARFEKELAEENPYKLREDYILYAGRLEQQKGLEMLLRAFSAVKNKQVTLKLIGSGHDRASLMALADELGIADRVDFIEHTKNIVEYYKKARLTVLSSYFEGFPNVLVESIACGTPVVSYDLPSGPSEIVLEGQNGYLASYLDVNDLTEKIDLALERDWDAAIVKQTAERYKGEIILEKYLKVVRLMMPTEE